MTFTLPLPPTKNQIHRFTRGHLYVTEKAKDWYKEAGDTIISQWKGRRTPLKGRTYIGIHYKLKRDRDLDSGEAILDLLQKMNVVENDNQIYEMRITKLIDKKGDPDVIVEVVKI